MERHDGRVRHEFTRSARSAKIINLFFVATDRDEGRHAVRAVAAGNTPKNLDTSTSIHVDTHKSRQGKIIDLIEHLRQSSLFISWHIE